MDFYFEFQQVPGRWVKYIQSHQDCIKSVLLKSSKVDLPGRNQQPSLQIDIQGLTQLNLSSNVERPIRFVLKSGEKEFIWQVADNSKADSCDWKLLDPVQSLRAETAVQSDNKCFDIELDSVSHTFQIVKGTNGSYSSNQINLKRVEKEVLDSSHSRKRKTPEADAATSRKSSRVTDRKGDAASGASAAKGVKAVENGDAADASTSKAVKQESAIPETKSAVMKSQNKSLGVRTVVKKGKAPVDPECVTKVESAHVYTEGKDIYDAMLNQTNIQNNNNKYYIIQLLEEDASKRYSVWFHWGRVGYKGQTSLVSCGGDLDKAKAAFCAKFADKTKNDWSCRHKFAKVAGKYDMVEIDYSNSPKQQTDSKIPAEVKPKKELPPSRLDKRVQDLINLICDVQAMEDAVVEMKYDAQKMPLGKLTPSQIKAGYAALKKVEDCIQNKKTSDTTLHSACSDFYTRIPHAFGMSRPPLIRDLKTLKSKIELLEALADIEVAIRTLNEESAPDTNPVDNHYSSMKCDLKPIEQNTPEFKLINNYLLNTHALTHNMYKMKVKNIFATVKHGENENYKDVGNKMLLWHGSRLTNWYGIISQGLRIAPPEAPMTGYMFGKGLYFADSSSKSANYCCATKTKSTGLVLLSEVSLGNTNKKMQADYKADNLPAGFESVWGLGGTTPDPKQTVINDDGTVVPCGKLVGSGVNNAPLLYNEYVIYNTKQQKMRYLVEVEFKFAY